MILTPPEFSTKEESAGGETPSRYDQLVGALGQLGFAENEHRRLARIVSDRYPDMTVEEMVERFFANFATESL